MDITRTIHGPQMVYYYHISIPFTLVILTQIGLLTRKLSWTPAIVLQRGCGVLSYKQTSTSFLNPILNLRCLRKYQNTMYMSRRMGKQRRRSASLLGQYNSSPTYIQNFKILAFFCDCTGLFVPELFENHIVGFPMRRLQYAMYLIWHTV